MTLADELVKAFPPVYHIFHNGKEILRTSDLARAIEVREQLKQRGIIVLIELY
jgi:hypothetical protein